MSKPNKFLWGRFVKRGVTLLFQGAPFAGKTILTMQFLKALQDCPSEGGEFLEQPIVPDVKAAYICVDKTSTDTVDTAALVGLDLSKVIQRQPLHPSVQEEPTEKKEHRVERLLAVLNELVETHKDLDLIIVEALPDWIGADINSYSRMSPGLRKLVQWNERFPDIAVIGLSHASKARSDFTMHRAMDRVNGSGVILAFTSSTMILEPPDEISTLHHKWSVTPRHAEPFFKWLKLSKAAGSFEVVNGRAPGKSGAADRVQDDILQILEAAEPTAIFRAQLKASVLKLGHKEGTFNKRLDEMRDEGLVESTTVGYRRVVKAL